jgi:DNA-directed RNA polymerase specialized sigma24 family protein
MELPSQQASLNLTQEDLQASRRLIEPICRQCGTDERDIDDVVQESWIVAFRRYNGKEFATNTYKGESFSSKQIAMAAMYACHCANNIAPNFRKRATRHTIHWSRLARSLEPESIGVCAPKQLEDIDERDLAACVWRQLTTEENELCGMLEQRLSSEEISARLGKTLDAYYKIRQRLYEKVRAILYAETPATEGWRPMQPQPPPGDN